MLALSTAWFAREETPLADLFSLLVKHGFQAFELNYVVHPVDLEEIRRLQQKLGFRIVSLHNVCSTLREPLEPDDQYGDNIASLNEEERRQAAMHLRSTAETAAQLGAKAVVIHGGFVPAAKEDQEYRRLRRAFGRGEIDSTAMATAMREKVAQRKALGRPHLEQLVKSLREVCPDFPDLRFGLECRYHYYSLPDVDELAEVLAEANLPNLGYWHDCGHAQVQENFGICRHRDWLERYGHCLIGMHLHGMADRIHDHYPPAPGNMPFEMVLSHLRPDIIQVLELGKFNDLESILAGRDYLQAVFTRGEVMPAE
ncbi:MAG: sugar phosphate isomerase/epimerase family protein [Anaerolineae bacterium]